jgi:hypothetical protein
MITGTCAASAAFMTAALLPKALATFRRKNRHFERRSRNGNRLSHNFITLRRISVLMSPDLALARHMKKPAGMARRAGSVAEMMVKSTTAQRICR